MQRLNRSLTSTLAIFLGIGISALLAGHAMAAPKDRAKATTAQDVVQQQQELLLNECKPTDEQQKNLKEKFAAKLEALTAWDKTNAEKLKAAETAFETARKSTDASAKKSAAETRKELEASRALSTAEADRAIQSILTEEQRAIWAGAQLAQTTLRRYQRSRLTEDQEAKIKSACVVAARELAAFEGDDKKTKQGRTSVQKSLQWAIDNVILTPDQRASRPSGNKK